jgi:hypothetical protein
MTEILITKTSGGLLAPADQPSVDYLAKIKLGEVVKVKATRIRNPKFHRKFMALLSFAFDAWEPGAHEYKGEPVQKNFDQFRGDVVILAGYFDTAIRLNGDTRITPKSISFASMGEDEFETLFSATVDVILARILKNYTRADVDQVVERLLAFT